MQEAVDSETNRGLTAEEYLKTLPKSFPDWNPRRSSMLKWPPCASLFRRYLNGDPTARIETIIPSLQGLDREHDQDGIEMRAVSSDCSVQTDQDILERLVDKLIAKLPKNCTDSDSFRQTLKVLAYVSASRPQLDTLLIRTLDRYRGQTPTSILIAAGHCLRQPQDIATFVKTLEERLSDRPQGMYWWFSSLANMLRYRIDALAQIDTSTCNNLAVAALDVFVVGQHHGRPSNKSMCMAMVIAYLLRRRRHDSDFMDPDSPFAGRIKTAFLTAKKALDGAGGHGTVGRRYGRLLQLMIDYIDRQGRGPIYVPDTE